MHFPRARLLFNSPKPWRVLIPSFSFLSSSSFFRLLPITPFNSLLSCSAWLSLVQLDSAWLCMTQLGSAWLSLAQLVSACLSLAQLELWVEILAPTWRVSIQSLSDRFDLRFPIISLHLSILEQVYLLLIGQLSFLLMFACCPTAYCRYCKTVDVFNVHICAYILKYSKWIKSSSTY